MATDKNTGVMLKSLLTAWITMVFGGSALLALFAPLAHKVFDANPAINFLRSTWDIADEVGPIVKISLIVAFGLLAIGFRKLFAENVVFFYLKSIVLAIIATLLVLAFLPATYSRGFGIGLTGLRFDSTVLGIYLIGAVAGGIVFAYVFGRLSQKAEVAAGSFY